MEVGEGVVIFAGPMQSIRTQPKDSFGCIVPGCASVLMTLTESIDGEFSRGWTDSPRPGRLTCTLTFECMDDGMPTRIRERCARLESEIREQASLCDPKVVSLADAGATMPSKRRTVHD